MGTELNTDSSLNNEQQLIMKGKVTNKQIESVLKKYISKDSGIIHANRRLCHMRELQAREHNTV